MASVSLRGVSSVPRDDGFALHGIDLTVPDDVVCTIIGPSGSGKSTLLRLVAGLDPVASGTVTLGPDDVTRWPPERRDVAWMPQENPLYPHLDVGENIGFGLRGRSASRTERQERVHAEARAAGVERLLRRMPRTLAAGERQATGLARASARLPAAYLLDEPLARIDAQERMRLRAELGRVFHGLRVPVLLATNDQTEALALGDTLAVLRDGRVVQHGATLDVYERPETTFVATFVGDPGMNLITGTFEAGTRVTYVRLAADAVPLTGVTPPLRAQLDGRPVVLGIRPEHLGLAGEEGPLAGTVARVENLGAARVVHVDLPGEDQLVVRVTAPGRLVTGQALRLDAQPRRCHLFDAVTGMALWHAGGSA